MRFITEIDYSAVERHASARWSQRPLSDQLTKTRFGPSVSWKRMFGKFFKGFQLQADRDK